MYDTLNIFRTAAAMARHAGARQATIARNIANADTPGFRALRSAPFRETLEGTGAHRPRTTRPTHLAGPAAEHSRAIAEPAPNGNAVSLESEMIRSVEASREHARALSIYRHAMNVVRLSIGRQ